MRVPYSDLRLALAFTCVPLTLVWPALSGVFPTPTTCWVIPSFEQWKGDDGEYVMGMPGGPPDRCWEDDGNFDCSDDDDGIQVVELKRKLQQAEPQQADRQSLSGASTRARAT